MLQGGPAWVRRGRVSPDEVATALPDYFSLFGLEPKFALDPALLTAAYRTVQARVHPDRFVAAGAAEQRAALQWATLANEAYEVLNCPTRRAAYLCEKNGVAVSTQDGTGMSPEFLDLQMKWRQSLERARTDRDLTQMELLRREARQAGDRELQSLQNWIDTERDFTAAAGAVQRLMFIDKFLTQVRVDTETGAG
jgi:molecular chaperone HscB